jgi:hypothetical protein
VDYDGTLLVQIIVQTSSRPRPGIGCNQPDILFFGLTYERISGSKDEVYRRYVPVHIQKHVLRLGGTPRPTMRVEQTALLVGRGVPAEPWA